ncbi:MAG TPA: hypothetical protein VIC07_11740 [Acidimicrobiia bacterium]|jgi:hypothetical protein
MIEEVGADQGFAPRLHRRAKSPHAARSAPALDSKAIALLG